MAHEVTMRDVVDRLKQIMYPGFDRDIVSFGLVKNVQASNGHVAFSLAFSTQDESTRRQITMTAKEAVERMPGVQDVQITGPPPGQSATAQGPAGGPAGQQGQPGQPGKIELPGVKTIVAVASGKGGVGKSTVSVNLSVALADDGASVGLLDADIYGPSIPTMMGVKDQPGVVGQKILPMIAHDIKMMSFGFLIPEDQSVTWRGPMVHQAVQQLLRDVLWGELDCLVIDMPPGTGDAHLTLTQSVPADRRLGGDDAPGRGPDRRAARRGHVSAGERAHTRHRRKHELFQLSPLRRAHGYLHDRRRKAGQRGAGRALRRCIAHRSGGLPGG